MKMAYEGPHPIPVKSGGTGDASLTANGVVLGNGTGPLGVTAVGVTGQFLGANTGSAPTWQIPPGSSIAITGDSGGALVGNSFTFTGGTTGLTFSGAGSTETLTGTAVVAHGGTGAATLTANGVLLGNGTSPVTATSAGTTGQFLGGNTGSAPTFQSLPSSSISITGDSGGALTGTSFTFTGGTTGLTFAGAGTAETVGGTLVVSNGGTGATTLTGILSGNGTSPFTATPAKLIIQEIRTSSSATDSTASNYVLNATPTTANGKQLFSLAITPSSASNILKITGTIVGNTSSLVLVAALFQDSTVNCLACWPQYSPTTILTTTSFTYYMTAGTTSSTTFKIRYGADSGTAYINQASNGNALGGSVFSDFIIQELQA